MPSSLRPRNLAKADVVLNTHLAAAATAAVESGAWTWAGLAEACGMSRRDTTTLRRQLGLMPLGPGGNRTRPSYGRRGYVQHFVRYEKALALANALGDPVDFDL